MCRLYGFHANEPTKVECTLVHAQNALLMQSRSDQRATHADGWGIGYFENGTPHLERRHTAAFEDAHFGLAAERVRARTVVAHVRLATVGAPSVRNAHPFSHGRWMFAHNGTVRAFDVLKDRIEAETDKDLRAERRGTTDSEAAFHWLLTRMRRANLDSGTAVPALVAVMAGAVSELVHRCAEAGAEKPPKLNFLLTDGRVLLASRWSNSLHWVERDGVRDCEICGIPHVRHDPDVQYRAVVIASEPISHESWREVPDRSIVAVDEAVEVHQHAIEG